MTSDDTSDDAPDLATRLVRLGRRIDDAIERFRSQGALHGAERQAAADLKLRHHSLTGLAASGQTPESELGHDVSVLRDTFERWLASLDQRSETGRL